MARYGVPDHITSDRSPQLCPALWAQLSQCLGTQHKLTTAYHPPANGMVEKSHRQLKDAIKAHTTGPTGLHIFLGYSSASGPPLRKTPASLLQSFSTVALWSFRASFQVSPSHRRLCSTSPPGQLLPTSPPGVPVTSRSLQPSLCSSKGLFCVCTPWQGQASAHPCLQQAIRRGLSLTEVLRSAPQRAPQVGQR